MSGALKEVRNRIKSVQSTQQITKAMKMVSAAKLRRAQDAITQMRPYAKKLSEMLSNIVSNSEGDVNMALAAERPVEKAMIIVITSDRGLCGGYNSNLIKLAKAMIVEKYPPAMILFRSFITTLLDKTEKILPSLTPENLKDTAPLMKRAF